MESKLKMLEKIINGSIEFDINEGVLMIRGYYSGDTIKLDLNCIDEEMLEQIIVEDDDDEEYDEED